MILKNKWIFPLVLLVFMLFGCGTGYQTNGNSSNDNIENVPKALAENEQFSFKLISRPHRSNEARHGLPDRQLVKVHMHMAVSELNKEGNLGSVGTK